MFMRLRVTYWKQVVIMKNVVQSWQTKMAFFVVVVFWVVTPCVYVVGYQRCGGLPASFSVGFMKGCKVVPVLNEAPRHEYIHCLIKHHAMKAYWGSGGIAPHILDLGTRWRWVVSFTLRPLYPQGKRPSYPLDRRLGGPQSRSGRGGEEKNSQPPPGIEL
jgi:hypothetical protein